MRTPQIAMQSNKTSSAACCLACAVKTGERHHPGEARHADDVAAVLHAAVCDRCIVPLSREAQPRQSTHNASADSLETDWPVKPHCRQRRNIVLHRNTQKVACDVQAHWYPHVTQSLLGDATMQSPAVPVPNTTQLRRTKPMPAAGQRASSLSHTASFGKIKSQGAWACGKSQMSSRYIHPAMLPETAVTQHHWGTQHQ